MSASEMEMCTAREMILLLRGFFDNALIGETKRLWDILTALRGPDNEDCKVKAISTQILRGYLFGNLHMIPTTCHGKLPLEFEQGEPHFAGHFRQAVQAIRNAKILPHPDFTEGEE